MRVSPKRLVSAFQLQGHTLEPMFYCSQVCCYQSNYYSRCFILVRCVGIRETTLQFQQQMFFPLKGYSSLSRMLSFKINWPLKLSSQTGSTEFE